MLLPMCQMSHSLVNGFVPLEPYLKRERPPLCGKNMLPLELGFCNTRGQNGVYGAVNIDTEQRRIKDQDVLCGRTPIRKYCERVAGSLSTSLALSPSGTIRAAKCG